MSQSKVFAYLLISFVVLSLISCASLNKQARIPTATLSKPDEKKSEPINWLSAFTLNSSQRNEALKTLTSPMSTNDILLRSIFLTHESSSYEELLEAERLLNNNFTSESSENENKDNQLRKYLLELNEIFQNHKFELSTLHEKMESYRRLIKKQQKENKILENKIDALTDIEHQINLRLDKNPQQVLP